LGSSVYQFSQRLDPIIWLVHEAEEIILWKSPSLTVVCGVALTLFIMNLKLSLLIAAIFLIFGKNFLIKYLEKINKKKNVQKRIWIPKENMQFLHGCMANFNVMYEKVHEFCLNEDKT
jgi:hypothetical protein